MVYCGAVRVAGRGTKEAAVKGYGALKGYMRGVAEDLPRTVSSLYGVLPAAKLHDSRGKAGAEGGVTKKPAILDHGMEIRPPY
jgi:hypothetical protein